MKQTALHNELYVFLKSLLVFIIPIVEFINSENSGSLVMSGFKLLSRIGLSGEPAPHLVTSSTAWCP